MLPWGSECPDHPRNWHKQEKRGTRHERGYGSAWDRVRAQVMLRDKGLCQPCRHAGRVSPATEVDHIVPKSQEGTDDSTNLQAICSPCHKVKTAMESRGDGASLRPEWLPPPAIPVTIICGPPGAGKTHLANDMARNSPTPHKILVVDTDEIASHQTGLPLHHAGKADRINAIRARNSLLASIGARDAGWDRAIVTMIGSGQDNRAWWKAKLNAELIVLQTPKDLCIARVQSRDIPLVRRLEQLNIITAWR